VVRGTRRLAAAVVAVLAGTLVVAGGSALGQPQAQQAYRLEVDAVAYYLPGKTALGVPVRKGVVAVDPRLIPLGTKMHVPGYGRALAADVGYAIKGRIIDLWFPSTERARAWGRRTVTIVVYR
jgi:3D (Asp-Asp-Asp) domain-containing protein